MLRSAAVPMARAWNTWSSRPAEMVFLPLGVRITPLAYADSTRAATLFPPGDGVLYGRHALDGSLVEMDLSHAGTRLAWRYGKSEPFEILGSWRTVRSGEWGLRFWINLCLSAEEGQIVRYDAARKAAIVKVGHRFVALASAADPVQVTGHSSIEALAERYETHGYFETASRSQHDRVLALRFNLEMTSENRFGVAVADAEDVAIGRAHQIAAREEKEAPISKPMGPSRAALDAIRDVTAWNTVWDEINQRSYTSISRNWNLAKFGGYGVWLNDQQYAAMLTDILDPEMGRENLAVALASATPDGNLACLLSANDAWVDRNQPPIGSFLVWLMYLRSRSRPLLEFAFETLSRNHAWWRRRRDPFGRDLVSYGTSDVGEGLYKGTSFGARNESAMDNSPIHDEAPYDPQTRTLASEDVGLNSLLALDAEMLALIAKELGHEEAAAFATAAARMRAKIRDQLWDEDRHIFANRLRSGRFVKSIAPTSFYPMLAGAATREQIAELLAHLDDPTKFGGELTIPGVSRDDPAFKDNTYWRGRIWPTFNYLVWQGLRRCGEDAAANALADRSFALFRRSWDGCRLCAENYNAETGEALDQPDTEGFYSWGALMALLGVARTMDIGPWRGWEITNHGEATTLGPIASPVGKVVVSVDGGVLTLAKGAQRLLVTNIRGAISQLHFGQSVISLVLPPMLGAEGAFLHFPDIKPENILDVLSDGQPASYTPLDGGTALRDLPGASTSIAIALFLHDAPLRGV
jgi:putative isomerase